MRTAFPADVRDTVLPGRNGRQGQLPPLLISMTLVTAAAVSRLLGRSDPAWVRPQG